MAGSSSSRMRPTRYAHFEGHTDLCYSDDGRYIITCGSDGEVRVFEGLDDDDCKTHVVAECAHAVAYRDGRFLVATDSNMVNAFTLDEGSPDGIVTRFTAPATHIVVGGGGGGRLVVCAGSDMTIRVHDAVEYKDSEFIGHNAPVLSVAIDPQNQFIASSSCDGTIKVWHRETAKVRISWDLLPHTNSVANSPTLCRLAFTPSGDLAVPVGPKVLLYERGDWGLVGELRSEVLKETISVIAISPDGQFLAGGCVDGTLAIWNLPRRRFLFTERHPRGHAYSGLAWNPNGKREIAFVDVNGQLGTVEVDEGGGGVGGGVSVGDPALPLGLENGTDDPPFPPLDDEDAVDDEAEISLSKIKAQLGFADDEEGTFLGLSSAGIDEDSKDAKVEQDVAPGPERSAAAPREVGVGLPAVQRPFQPSMSPEHLTERYMLWNSVGIVRQYTGDNESSIDVEFHDSSVHHSLHINNAANHSMAALSTQVLALAAESAEGVPSKVVTQQLSGGKEWHCDMPEGEEILALAVGTDWLAVATDLRNLRIFGTCGTQRHVMALPGPVVCLAGHEKCLMVVFHSGVGVSGDQCMATVVLNLGGKPHPVPQASPVALSPRAYLAWAGFSDEGTPVIMDSLGQVRLLNRALGNSWTTILDTRKHVKGKSDHYFLVGVNEVQQNVRCVLCRGARYPPTLPRPYLSLLTMQIPICEPDTEKGGLEQQMMQATLTCSRLAPPNAPRRAPKTPEEEQNDRVLQEAMIKLFALAVGANRECRAMEVCRLMPGVDTVQLAIKYAAKKQRMALAERLGQLAATMAEEAAQEEEEEEEEEWRFTERRRRGRREEEEEEEEAEDVLITQEEEEDEEEEEEEDFKKPKKSNPLLEAAKRISQPSSASPSPLATKNPFKKSLASVSPAGGGLGGLQALDSLRKAEKKEAASSSVLRPVVRKGQKKKSSATPEIAKAPGKENTLGGSQTQTQTPNPFRKTPAPSLTPSPAPSPAPKPRAPLHLWMDDNMELLKATYPEAQDKELLVKAAILFKDLDTETKKKYKTMAETPPPPTPIEDTPTPTEARKRPREEEEDKEEEEEEAKKKKGGSGLSKLSAFVFAAKE